MDHLPRLMRMIRHAQEGGTTGGGEGTGTTDGNAGGTQAPTTQTGDSGSSTESGNRSSDATFTKADVDREVSKALATREEKLRREQAEKEQNWEALAKQNEAELNQLRLGSATSQMLAKSKLSHLAPVFESDFSTIEGRTSAAESLNKLISAEVERRINERLKTDPPARSTDKPPVDKQPHEMTPEEFEAYKKSKNLL